METNEIYVALESTVTSLQGGVQRLGIEAALPVIEGWEGRLAASEDPELTPIAENLGELRIQLSASDLDQAAVGRLLATLGDQVQRLANSNIQIEVADRLSQLSALLSVEGDSLSGE
ncbi:MAG: hypothetical protein AVDCRST_MAG78-1644 [uncultured Rubrobacteraceae bacterium]|uniref:Uncharacterized protein n=1 Tax=uncultured Rubrobacteraceae bacterium TaxID=349277 RepID=A0A6J4Q1L0_9ACTN|nr:MAG: hypothetical protein AVDCRST_MAG78-1644 [uncultured Rubrobacteraceae bacterium]